MNQRGLALHLSHDQPFGYCYSYNERVAYIKENKPSDEIPLRLRLFQIVPEKKIPGRDSQAYVVALQATEQAAWQAWQTWQTRQAWGQAWQEAWKAYVVAWQEAWQAWQQAYLAKFHAELEALHKEICPDCPWDGKTIFTRKDDEGRWY